MDGTSVAEIFTLYGESFFRDKEVRLETTFHAAYNSN